MPEPRIFTGIDKAGTHWLATVFDDSAEIATRRDVGETWSVPVVLTRVDTEPDAQVRSILGGAIA